MYCFKAVPERQITSVLPQAVVPWLNLSLRTDLLGWFVLLLVETVSH